MTISQDEGKIAADIAKKTMEATKTAAQGQPVEAVGKIGLDIAKRTAKSIAGQTDEAGKANKVSQGISK